MFFKVSPLSLACTQIKKRKKKIRSFQRPRSSRGTEQEGDTQQERVSSREEGVRLHKYFIKQSEHHAKRSSALQGISVFLNFYMGSFGLICSCMAAGYGMCTWFRVLLSFMPVSLSKIKNAFAVQLLICPNQGDNGWLLVQWPGSKQGKAVRGDSYSGSCHGFILKKTFCREGNCAWQRVSKWVKEPNTDWTYVTWCQQTSSVVKRALSLKPTNRPKHFQLLSPFPQQVFNPKMGFHQ